MGLKLLGWLDLSLNGLRGINIKDLELQYRERWYGGKLDRWDGDREWGGGSVEKSEGATEYRHDLTKANGAFSTFFKFPHLAYYTTLCVH